MKFCDLNWSGVKPTEYHSYSDLKELLLNNSLDGIVLNQYYSAFVMESVPDSLVVEIEDSEPMSTGFVFIPPSNSDLTQCLQRNLFLRNLEIGDRVLRKLQHRQNKRVSAHNAALQAMNSGSYLNFIIMAAVLVALILTVGLIDYFLCRHFNSNSGQQWTAVDQQKSPDSLAASSQP